MTIRERWRKFRNSLLRHFRRKGEKVEYVMNYELHPGYLIKVVPDRHTTERVLHGSGHPHGWHIHGVINTFLPYEFVRRLLDKSGFGRFDFRRVNSRGISDYLTKHALKAYRGLTRKEESTYDGLRVRLVNTSRGLPPLNSYEYRSELISRTREIQNRIRSEGEIKSLGVKFPDYRRLHSISEVCAQLGLNRYWQLLDFVEFLGYGLPCAVAVKTVLERNDINHYPDLVVPF